MSYFDYGFRPKKRKSKKFVTIKGKRFQAVPTKRRSSRRQDGVFDNLFSMGGQQSTGGYAQETSNNLKGAVQMGKNVYNSPAASFIKRKIQDRIDNRSYKGFSSTKVGLGSAPVGHLKPTKNELRQLKGSSRIRYY